MCEKLEKEVDSRLTIRAERLWSFRFCDSVSCQFHTSTIFPTNPTFHMLCIIHHSYIRKVLLESFDDLSGVAAFAEKC